MIFWVDKIYQQEWPQNSNVYCYIHGVGHIEKYKCFVVHLSIHVVQHSRGHLDWSPVFRAKTYRRQLFSLTFTLTCHLNSGLKPDGQTPLKPDAPGSFLLRYANLLHFIAFLVSLRFSISGGKKRNLTKAFLIDCRVCTCERHTKHGEQ